MNNQAQNEDKNNTTQKKPTDKPTKKKFVVRSIFVLLKFYGLFVIFIAIGYFLSTLDHTFQIANHSINFKSLILTEFPGFVAQSVGYTAKLLGINVLIYGENVRFLTFKGFEISVIPDEAGYFLILIYSAAVIAFPSRISDKIYGLLIGIPGLYFINITRLLFTGLVCSKYQNLYDYLHEYIWQGILIVLVIGLLIVWREFIVKNLN